MKNLVGGTWHQLWRDVFVASLQGLLSNPEMTARSEQSISKFAALQADAAVEEFDTRVRNK